MPRINVEDDIEREPEFWKLLDLVREQNPGLNILLIRNACLGMLVDFFRLCQKRWVEDFGAVSIGALEKQGLKVMVESGWAVPWKEGFQALGAESQFRWLVQRHEAGAKGGRPPKKRDEPDDNRSVSAGNREEPAKTGENPLSLSLSPTQKKEDLLENKKICSPASAGELFDSVGEAGSEKTGPPSPATRPAFDFEAVYESYPKKMGKARGLELCRKQVRKRSQYEALKLAIKNYVAYQERKLDPNEFRPGMKQFDTFMAEKFWLDWVDPDPKILWGKAGPPRAAPARDQPPETASAIAPMTEAEIEAECSELEREGNAFVGSMRRALLAETRARASP